MNAPDPMIEAVVLDTSDREIALMRRFAAPRALVYEAFTQPEHLAQWWGPDGFTITTYEMNVAEGGVWRYMMHGPDGTDYPNKMTYSEVVPNERLVYDQGDFDTVMFQGRVTFADVDGGTEVTLHLTFPTAEACQIVKEQYGAVEGGQQTLAHLAEYLKRLAG